MGETTFHVCFLMGSPTHMYCAKRILKWYPKLLHDIYLSEVLKQWGLKLSIGRGRMFGEEELVELPPSFPFKVKRILSLS